MAQALFLLVSIWFGVHMVRVYGLKFRRFGVQGFRVFDLELHLAVDDQMHPRFQKRDRLRHEAHERVPVRHVRLIQGLGVRKEDIRLHGKGNPNSHGARPVYSNQLDH